MKRLRAVLLGLVVCAAASAQYFPAVGGNATGGGVNWSLPGDVTITVPGSAGAKTMLVASSTYSGSVTGCIPYQETGNYGQILCDANWTRTPGGGNVIIKDATGPVFTLFNTSGTQNAMGVEYKTNAGRQWYFGTGGPSTANTGLVALEYTDGVFQRTSFYLKKGGTTCIGANNSECTTGTVTVKDGTASTGATRVLIQNGAADARQTYTLISSASISAVGDIRPIPASVANLGSCPTKSGAIAGVTDAASPVVGSAVAGSGSTFALVYCSATASAWVVLGL